MIIMLMPRVRIHMANPMTVTIAIRIIRMLMIMRAVTILITCIVIAFAVITYLQQ